MNDDSAKTTSSDTFTLTDNRTGKAYELPVLKGTLGPHLIDVRKLYSYTLCFTYDLVFISTALF